MARHDEQIDPMRLVEAAEAALLAVVEVAEHLGSSQPGAAWVWPPDLMGTSIQPECLAPFTKWEIEQASRFLVRLGMLDIKQTRQA